MAVIEFDHVTKTYQLGKTRTSLREALTLAAKKLIPGNGQEKSENDLLYAVDDLSFQVNQGEVLGFIGHNGAGKSTILKLLSKVTFPTSGEIRTQGRMAALIELGAGFHPDLSGRENIYMNGAILGLKKHELDAQLDSIIDFAGLERFIDTPIKRYSSGMYVRLAFSVASHVKADLLLVDEVLSVGDMEFQKKSLAKMNQLRDNGATIIFVSHNLSAVKTFCSRVILMDHGKSVIDSDPDTAVAKYFSMDREKDRQMAFSTSSHEDIHMETSLSGDRLTDTVEVSLLNVDEVETREFKHTEGMIIRCQMKSITEIVMPLYEIYVRRRRDGVRCFTHYFPTTEPAYSFTGDAILELEIRKLLLVPGEYLLDVIIRSNGEMERYLTAMPTPFTILGEPYGPDEGFFTPTIEWLKMPGLERPVIDEGEW